MIQHLEILIDCFVLSFKDGGNYPAKNSFDDNHVRLVEIKDFNALIDNKLFFD